MHDLGDEIILESYRIPWLIWIQLLVLFLLILLLSYFGLFSLDFAPAGSSPPSAVQDDRSCFQGGNQQAQEERARARESNVGSEASSMKDLQRLFHPCYYFELAKQAFLQCLGLGCAPPNSRERGRDE